MKIACGAAQLLLQVQLHIVIAAVGQLQLHLHLQVPSGNICTLRY